MKNLDIKPTGSKIIVKQDDLPDLMGGIFVPQNSKEMESWEGEVVAIGEHVTMVKNGDKVMFGKYSGYNFERDRERYLFLEEEDILGIINSSPVEVG